MLCINVCPLTITFEYAYYSIIFKLIVFQGEWHRGTYCKYTSDPPSLVHIMMDYNIDRV